MVSRETDPEADALGVPVYEPATSLPPCAAELDERLGGRLTRLAGEGELRGSRDSALVLHLDGELKARRLVAAGVGDRGNVDADAVRTAAGAVARAVKGFGSEIAWRLDGDLPVRLAEQARAVVRDRRGGHRHARHGDPKRPGARTRDDRRGAERE